jgi:pimeloyl-ACP methyl ester carboxylesterase
MRRAWSGMCGCLVAGAVAVLAAAPATAASNSHYVGVLQDGGQWEADVPSSWNGTLLLFSHGYGEQTAEDAPDQTTQQYLLDDGYALAGSSYDQAGSLWALDSAVHDQFETLAAVEDTVLPRSPTRVIAVGQSMGGLVSALEDQDADGRIDGALTTCGLVAGGVNLENYQLDGSYAIAELLDPSQNVQLVGYQTAAQAAVAAEELQQAAQSAQQTPQGRARLALASALYNVTTWTATNLLSENTNPLIPPQTPPASTDYNQQELEQYYTQYAPGSIVLPFIQTGRWSIEQAAGGQPAWDAGVDFAKVLAGSPYDDEVKSLYKEAGLDLSADLNTLTRHADIKAQLPAYDSLTATSVPTGKLQVPELDIHTIADQLIPVQQENYYGKLVSGAGSGSLLRQAYTEQQGHCNFTSAEIIAALHALEHRIDTGGWGTAANPNALQAAATALDEGGAAYVPYTPGTLTATNQPFDPSTQGYTPGGIISAGAPSP